MPKLSRSLAAALLLCAGVSARAAGSGSPFAVDVFSTAQGLPSGVVLAVTQTRDGYLWAGTLAGLARFDGVDFSVFDENNTPGLNSSKVRRLYEDRQSNLWIGMEDGGIAFAKDGKVTPVQLGPPGAADPLMAICEDPSGAVLLWTDGGVLARYRDGKVERCYTNSPVHNNCRTLVAEPNGAVLMGADWSLVVLDPFPVPASRLEPARVNYLLASKGGGYWCLINDRIQKYKQNRLEKNWEAYPWTNTLPVLAACEDLDGNLVVGTYGDGVYWFDADGKYSHISNEEGLSHASVVSLLVDQEGSLWVATNGGGLNRVRRKRFAAPEPWRGSVVQSICEDSQGTRWIGCTGNRVYRWVTNSADEFRFLQPAAGRDANADVLVDVKSVFVGVNRGGYGGNWVLAGSWSARPPHLMQFERGHFVRIENLPNWLADVSAMFQDAAGRLWLGTQGGLFRLDDLRLFTTRDGLSADAVRAIAEDRDGSLWVGTEGGGLNRFRDGRFTAFTKASGLPGNSISALEVDSQGVLWAATSGGLARYQGGKWTCYTKREGLGSNNLTYMLDDGHGYLWFGSNAGLLRVKKSELDAFAEGRSELVPCRIYGEADGLPSAECTSGSQPGPLRSRDGTLLFPTTQGVALLNPARLGMNTNPPPVVIEAVRVGGRLRTPEALCSAPPRSVTIAPGQEGLVIRYASLNLAAPDKGRFTYILERYEKRWTERSGNIREAVYGKLPPGEYLFQVRACNEDDVWNHVGASLAIIVLPPFWQTWWFIGAVSVVILGFIVGSVHYVSTQRLQRQLAALRQKEALEKERARIARDIHDQVGASLTQISLLGELVEGDKDQPAEVEAHARQIEHTALETTRALDEIVWTVNPSNDTLDGLVTYVCKYAQEYLAVAGLKYRLDVPSQLPSTPISPELRHNVFLASKESITNVVRHAQATAVVVRLHLDEKQFSLEIQDNGRGLGGMDSKAAEKRNGLTNMRKRMEDIGGSFSIAAAPEGGTLVRLVAPLGDGAV